eukprot:gene26223-34309_t
MVYFEKLGRVSTPVHFLSALPPYTRIPGPAIIIQNVATVVIEPEGDIEIVIEEQGSGSSVGVDLDPIYLSIFSHRFMGIA